MSVTSAVPVCHLCCPNLSPVVPVCQLDCPNLSPLLSLSGHLFFPSVCTVPVCQLCCPSVCRLYCPCLSPVLSMWLSPLLSQFVNSVVPGCRMNCWRSWRCWNRRSWVSSYLKSVLPLRLSCPQYQLVNMWHQE